jgi:tetratricopeptide (TPR) repeat protein
MREGTLDRLIRIGLVVVVVAVGFEAVRYALDWWNEPPSLLERQLSAAEDAVRAQPSETGLRLRLAEVYRVADRPGDALTQYDEVLELEPEQSTALVGRAEVLAEEGEHAEAASTFRQVIEAAGGGEFAAVDPQLETAYYGLGGVLLEQGKAKQATGALRRAAAIEPTDADAWYLLGTAALKAGRPSLAVKALRQAVLFVPADWCEPYERLTEAYADLNRKPYAEYAAAMVDLCEGRPDDAARRLRPLTSGPAAVDAMFGLGMAAEAESNRAAAALWYRRVLAVDSENFNARSNLSRLADPQSGTAPLPADHADTGGA